MKSRKTANFLATVIGCCLVASILIPACAGYSTCEDRGYCAGASAGRGDMSGNGGDAPGGSSGEGASSGTADAAGSSGANDGGASGSAGEGGGTGCDADCKGETPVCNAASNTCVQCLDGTDCKAPTPVCDTTSNSCVECTKSGECKDSAKPFCDGAASKCVACLKQADCKEATASACNAGVCTACTKDEQCSDVAGKGVCDAGTCVQCTVEKETACAGKSCDPATKQCTVTSLGSRDLCEPCVADSECTGGNQADPEARCVPMKFMGTSRPGGFCLRRFAKTCSKPYFLMPTALASLSGAVAEPYCGIDQDSTQCEAVLDFLNSKSCATDGKDTSCGCTRDKTGVCTAPGKGGLCKTVIGVPNTCTIPCGVSGQCTTVTTCPSVNYCH